MVVADDRAARVLRLARDIAELELRLADCVAQLEALDREAHDEREEVSDGVGQARRGGH